MADRDGADRPDDVPVTLDPVAFVHAVDRLPVGMLVYAGPDHVLVGANATGRAIYGHRPDVLGRPVREISPETAGQQLFEMFDRVYATGEPVQGHEWRIVLDVSRRGELEERFVDFLVQPVRGPDGQVTGLAVQFLDVTDGVRRRQDADDETAELQERYEVAQNVVLTLQRSLLPAGLPVLPGLRIAAQYLVASAEQAAGGDWFDAVPLDGRVAVVVGDVVGHGAAASAVMGQLRAVLVEFLLDGDDVTMALARLDRFAARVPGARGATVCVALLDPSDGSLRYACAGHPPPLLMAADGATRFLPSPGGSPLGVAGPAPVEQRTTTAAGDLLLCFSDGIVEHPRRDLPTRLRELADVASAALRVGSEALMALDPADRVAALTVERMTREGYFDDVTLLAVRLTGQVAEPFAADIAAEPGQLSGLRRRLEAWLEGLGASEADVVSIELAVLEAVTNSVEHAYPAGGGRVQVEGVLDGEGRACMTVLDQGTWRPADADPGVRGRGLLMMRGCMDTVEIEHSVEGTTLLLDRTLRQPPVVGQPSLSGGAPHGPDLTEVTVTTTGSAEPRVAVRGPVDISTVEELRRQLWSAGRGGALPLTVELGDVTHLASAGVQLFYEFAEEMTAGGRKLELVAPAGCPARHALALSGLDQVVTVV